ncbi:hypothetical protein Agub_g1185 [Astrephomene gubernaculifera]|uniref:Uncharacterized protein n=1 Tax=Astrephomene gubernaculifera TaxID=47775 RepID=A0AAD3DF20_9CHLO|nr:hypothetical protein Agub_g1185 [Astrephomene gubernaculifera]
MGSYLPRGPPCCPKIHQASASPFANRLAQGLACRTRQRSQRLAVNAFLFNMVAGASSNSKNKEAISSRLSELRRRDEEEDRAFLSEQSSGTEEQADGVDESLELARPLYGPLPADAGSEDGSSHPGGLVTARSLRFSIADPKPEIKLLHRFKPGRGPDDTDPWRSFLDKCRLAWGVFFPPAPKRSRSQLATWAGGIGSLLATAATGSGVTDSATSRTAKQVVTSRLQMVLIADRCGVSPESLLEMKAQTLAALAEYMGKDLDDDVSQLEVQVSALKPSGERITMTIGFADMLGDEQRMDPLQYDYEFEDEDDYFYPEEEEDFRVGEIIEVPALAAAAEQQDTSMQVAAAGSEARQ